MKLNKKGWGTLEMLLLTGGLLIALIIAIFFISNLYGSIDSSVGNKQYMDLENKIEDAAKNYIDSNNIEVNGDIELSLNSLRINGYLKEFNDSNGDACNGYVKITTMDGINHYSGYILCNGYQTNDY